MRAYTKEEYIEKIKYINPHIVLVGEYTNTSTATKHICTIDGYEWDAVPQTILKGGKCPQCLHKEVASHYKTRLTNIHPNIIMMSEYTTCNDKMLYKCKICGHKWEQDPYNLLNSKGCPECHKFQYTHSEYVSSAKNKNPLIDVLGIYSGNKTKILHKCKQCGYMWDVAPHDILGGNGCPVCGGKIIGPPPKYLNSIWANEDHRKFYQPFLTEEQMKKYRPYGTQILTIKCPDCGREKEIKLSQLRSQGLGCICSDGVSYPNKFVHSVLTQLKLNIDTEYCPKWSGKKRYDIYLPKYNIIIENHGLQHYEGWNLKHLDLEKQIKNDADKYNTAIQNGIKPENYIVIDCRISNVNYIKKSIMNSVLPSIFNFTEEDIDWVQADIDGLKNKVKQSADLYNQGYSPREIIGLLQSNKTIINRYLKRATQLGWCNYDPKFEQRQHKPSKDNHNLAIKVYCLETNQVFGYIKKASAVLGVSAWSITKSCQSQDHIVRGVKYHMYYLYDKNVKNQIIPGAITLGLITEEEALAQLNQL